MDLATVRPAGRGADAPEHILDRRTLRQRGLVLAIFAAATILFVGILAIVIDVSWYWASSLRVQRAADAAALAGVVWLPGHVSTAQQAAYNEASKDGYTTGVGGVTITATQDSTAVSGGDPNQLDVTVNASVDTFFMRLFGITKIQATRSSKAIYVLPVPMGSPQNYYGDFGKVRYPGSGESASTTQTTTAGPSSPTGSGTATWTTPQYAYSGTSSQFATIKVKNTAQTWNNFGFSIPSGATVLGIQVVMTAKIAASTCQLSAALSWNNGTSYTTAETTTNLTTTATSYGLGGASDTWGHTWSPPTDLNNGKFIIQLTNPTACGTNMVSVRQLQISVTYKQTVTTTLPDANLTDPNGGSLTPQGFWGTIMSQGGESINGDLYAPYYDNNGGTKTNSSYYNASNYYNYDVQMRPGSSNGRLWIYDAPFCASGSNGQYGTGDRWFNSTNGISTFYDLYDTKLTNDTSDDTLVWSSGNTFKETQSWSDPDLSGSGGSSCSKTTTSGSGPAGTDGLGTQCNASATSGLDCHLRWYQLPVTLTGGTLYRLHVSTTDPNSPTDQLNSDGHNSFTLWATAAGTAPRVYGVGAMETFEPLPGGGASIFYLAQIGAEHAGKTMEIKLWDPGDTNPLPASLSILAPTTSGYTATTFSWSAQKLNSQGQSCTSSGSGVTSVTTNVGATTGTFNGCMLTITVPLPTNYTAPTPPGETNGGGWWKIEYDMGGSSSTNAYDLTTWQVDLLGNPVHLVVP